MALFKSSGDKASELTAKEQKLLDKYGLSGLYNPEDLASVKKIASELAGSGMMEAGLKMSTFKADVLLPISYQRTIMEQNFIIIRQLDRLAKMLER